MNGKMKRITISISSDLGMKLDEIKKENYSQNTEDEMLQDLIMRGLQESKDICQEEKHQ